MAKHSGHAATRQEIQRQLWGQQTYVDFRCGVNFCIRQIRKALGESARNHRYIETLHRRGYRFKVPVTTVESLTGTDFAVIPESQSPRKPRSRRVLPSCHSVIWVTARQVNWPMEYRVADDPSCREPSLAGRLTNHNQQIQTRRQVAALHRLRTGRRPDLEGAVLHSGGRARVTARLIDVRTDRSRWGATYDFIVKNDLDLQEASVRAMIRDSAVYLDSKPSWTGIGGSGISAEADLLYHTGCYYLNKRTEKALFKAVECFQRAIVVSPENAAAYAGLARTFIVLAYYGPYLPREVHGKAKAAALRAIKLDPTQADAHAVLAYCNMLYGWNWRKAEAGFRKAIALDPCSVTAHQWYGDFLVAMKRHDESIEEMRRARARAILDAGRFGFRLGDAVRQPVR